MHIFNVLIYAKIPPPTHTHTKKDISPHQVTKVKGSEYVFMCIFILISVCTEPEVVGFQLQVSFLSQVKSRAERGSVQSHSLR